MKHLPPAGPEPDEDVPPPTEPNGAQLTEKRKRQQQGREAAEKLWKEILTNIQKAQRNE